MYLFVYMLSWACIHHAISVCVCVCVCVCHLDHLAVVHRNGTCTQYCMNTIVICIVLGLVGLIIIMMCVRVIKIIKHNYQKTTQRPKNCRFIMQYCTALHSTCSLVTHVVGLIVVIVLLDQFIH